MNNTIELSIGNPFQTKVLREERKPTVFTRAIARLTDEKKHPGQIMPIFAVIEKDYKIFGALTLNTGGSVSFFPDFYNLDNFDHLTMNGDFILKKGHLTKIETDGKRKKPIHLVASELKSGNYHLITFLMKDGDLLMDAPPEIDYGAVEYQDEAEQNKFHQWINESVGAGHLVIEFPDEDGNFGIQIQLIDKAKPAANFAVESSVIENSLAEEKSLKDVVFNVRQTIIPTSEKSDFDVCILTFRLPYEIKSPFIFSMAADTAKHRPKVLKGR